MEEEGVHPDFRLRFDELAQDIVSSWQHSILPFTLAYSVCIWRERIEMHPACSKMDGWMDAGQRGMNGWIR